MVALAVGAGLILVAYLLRADGFDSLLLWSADKEMVETTPTITPATIFNRQTIEIVDSDGDGLRDWEEELIGAGATTSTSVYQPPNTVTGQFGISFIRDIILSKQAGTLAEESDDLVAGAIQSLEQGAVNLLYTKADIQIHGDNSPKQIATYGNAVGRVLAVDEKPVRNELEIIESALLAKNEMELAELDPIIASYSRMRDGLLALAVPSDLADVHLELINYTDAAVNNITALRQVFTDPLPALLHLGRHQSDVAGIYLALSKLNIFILDNGIMFRENELGKILHTFRPEQ